MTVSVDKQHVPDKVCRCHYCLIIDIVFGEPQMTQWEKKFIDSVARQGWQRDYSEKQKAIINKIYRKYAMPR